LLLVGAGCKEKKLEPGLIVADKQVALADMKPDDVIVSVNGKALTRKAHDDKLDLLTALYAIRRSSATKATIDAYRANRAARIIPDYVMLQLALEEGRRLGISISPEELAEAELKTWRSAASRRLGDDFAAALGPQTALFKKTVAEDALVRATRQNLFGDRLVISEEDIDKVAKQMADWNASYAESNKVVVAQGEEIVRKLRDGADFAETAKEVSQFQPEEGELWGEFTHAEIEDKVLRELAFKLPIGAISDPVDTEDGLIIIRVLERTDGATVDSPLATQVATVKLARILLLMYNPHEERNREEIRLMILSSRNTKIQQEWAPQLHAAARIEYPNGTNLWPRAKSSSRRNR